ncbi:MAG: hypothetical protein P4L26_06715 [Terracidiphilus sp.]|jgi:hypothetical protein|nr:hypothetical protein [Terracidiphilus sp.]
MKKALLGLVPLSSLAVPYAPRAQVVAAGERLVAAVPGGCWKALQLHHGMSYALMANALSP